MDSRSYDWETRVEKEKKRKRYSEHKTNKYEKKANKGQTDKFTILN